MFTKKIIIKFINITYYYTHKKKFIFIPHI